MSSKFLNNAVNPIAITDVIGLQDELDEIQEEITSGGGNKTVETFTQQIASTPAGFGEYKLYAKSDGFYERGTGAEVKLAGGGGGGGGIDYIGSSDVVNEGLVFASGLSRNLVQNKTGYRLDSFNNKLVVPDIQFPTITSAETTITENKNKLRNIENDGAITTLIAGELSVGKIKNTTGTADIELDNTGLTLKTISSAGIIIDSNNGVNIVGDTGINISTTLNNITHITPLSIDFLDTTLLTGLKINPSYAQLDFLQTNNLVGRIALINGNDLTVEAPADALYLSGWTNATLTAQNGNIGLDAGSNIVLSAGGLVTTTKQATTNNCIVNKSYLEANKQPKPAVYYLGATTDYNPATAPIHTINHIEAGVATFLNIGWNGSSSGGLLQVRLSANYPASYATTSTVEGSATVTNKYKYLPLNPTTANSYTINSNYIDDGSIVTCMISPIQTAQTPPIAPTRPVIKITIHNLENADNFGSNSGYVMIIEQF